MKKFVIIVGPTGSGKTRLSIEVAKFFHGEIINGDSVQVYRGLDIGSAKIKVSEMMGIKHHLLDIREPNKSYSVYEFQQDVRSLLDKIDFPVIVGGTGFYINAAISNYEFIEEKRDHTFDEKYADKSNLEIYHELLSLDPEITIDSNNRRRILRALEQALQGTPRSKKQKKDEKLYQPLIIYLDLPKDVLMSKLWERLEIQLKDGFVDEVKSLKDHGIKINAIGYREIEKYLSGELSYEAMKEAIIKASKILAKKQKTYFMNQMKPNVFDALSNTLVDDVISLVKNYVEENHERD